MHKVLIVDDHRMFRETLRKALVTEKIANVLADVSNGKELLELLDQHQPQIILMDISMPVMDGIEATKKALEKQPDVKVLTLSQFGDEKYYYSMLEAGAKGFILKSSGIDELKNAIAEVANGGSWVSGELFQKVVLNLNDKHNKTQASELSDRELNILQHICSGLNNEQIASEINLSFDTIRWYRARLMSKTGCSNTAGLVMYAVKNKLIEF
jgi:DNA-binding NarL/FixJ family response regulator